MTETVHLMRGKSGSPVDLEGRTCVSANAGVEGALLYGPYDLRDPGHYRIEFEVALADGPVPMGNPVSLVLDVCADDGTTKLAEVSLLYSHLNSQLSHVVLEFDLLEPRSLEYRVFPKGQVAVTAAVDVGLTRTGDAEKIARTKTAEEQAWQNEREFLDGYLRNVTGLIHVGANLGQERQYYWLIGLDVIWVEPIREIYETLVNNISSYPRQSAINALLADRAGEQIEFRIANNNGASSSILALEDHAVIFPGVDYVEHRKITSTTLDDLVSDHQIPLDLYQALTLDVEGAEQLVLQGSRAVLRQFRYVKCEVADFPARTGTPTVADLDDILRAEGFAEIGRRPFAVGPSNRGTFWDVVWKKVVPGQVLHEAGHNLPLVFNPLEVATIEKID